MGVIAVKNAANAIGEWGDWQWGIEAMVVGKGEGGGSRGNGNREKN